MHREQLRWFDRRRRTANPAQSRVEKSVISNTLESGSPNFSALLLFSGVLWLCLLLCFLSGLLGVDCGLSLFLLFFLDLLSYLDSLNYSSLSKQLFIDILIKYAFILVYLKQGNFKFSLNLFHISIFFIDWSF